MHDISNRLDRIETAQFRMERLLIALAQGEKTIMSQQTDLDAALAAEGTDLDALTAAVASIEAKLAATPGAPDLSAELAQVTAFDNAIKAATASTAPAPGDGTAPV